MLRKQWNEYASRARDIAKHIVTGAEESRKTHVRWSKVIDYLDVLATSALNEKYANDGSKSNIHTYWGGNQEIATEHADGSNGIFRTNGSCESTNNPMDIEVKEYINNLGENKQYNMNKKLIRLTESDLHRIVKESVKTILREKNRMIKEGGDLYGHYDDGTPFTNSKRKFHGIPGTVFIWHGEWSDPEVWYNGKEYNATMFEDTFWDMYKTECEEEGREPTDREYDNLPTEWFEEKFEDIIFGMTE